MKTRSGHLFKRNGVYHVQWRVDGKLFMRSTHKRNRKDAEQERVRIMGPFVTGDEVTVLENVAARIEGKKAELVRHEEEKHPPLPLSQAWHAFETAPGRPDSGEATLRQYACQFGNFVRWMEAKQPNATMRAVTRDLAEEYASHLASSGKSPNTYNKYINLLQLVFRVLKVKAKLTENPWEDIPRKRLATQSRRELTVEELRKVCLSAAGELRLLFALGIYTGLRLGDCATLRWGEVDLHRRIIRRIPHKVSRRRNLAVLIPIHPVLLSMIEEIPAHSRKDYVLPETAAAYEKRSDEVTDRIQAHFHACGVRTHKPGTGHVIKQDEQGKDRRIYSGKRAVVEVGFHSLRHTFVSLCREANAPLAVVEAIVGHANPAMTRHYTHIGETAATTAVAALPDVTGTAEPALPAGDTVTIPVATLRELAEGITPDNAAATKKALLGLLVASENRHRA